LRAIHGRDARATSVGSVGYKIEVREADG